MNSADTATIHALRSDLALQIARHIARSGHSQSAIARQLGMPQPTLSKIVNGQVAELSLELLLRITVRASLPIVLQTGLEPAEAGAYVAGRRVPQRTHPSRLAEGAESALNRSESHLTPEQRLDAQLTHSELLTALQKSARTTPRRERRKASPSGP